MIDILCRFKCDLTDGSSTSVQAAAQSESISKNMHAYQLCYVEICIMSQ